VSDPLFWSSGALTISSAFSSHLFTYSSWMRFLTSSVIPKLFPLHQRHLFNHSLYISCRRLLGWPGGSAGLHEFHSNLSAPNFTLRKERSLLREKAQFLPPFILDSVLVYIHRCGNWFGDCIEAVHRLWIPSPRLSLAGDGESGPFENRFPLSDT